jgi:8-oxo-dGTP pyrophosphatase MutT (NUDIX family)
LANDRGRDFAAEVRFGHRPLWIATARAVTVDSQGHVIPGRYAGRDTWTLPGGVIEPAEQPADGAVRECYEETGIAAVPEALTQHLDITFRCMVAGARDRPCDGEFEEVRWHRIDSLPELMAMNWTS